MSEPPSISKFRSVASQLCAVFPYFSLAMSYGVAGGFQTILIAELYKDNSEIVATVSQLSSFAGLDILHIMGLTLGAILTQYFGTRLTVFLTSLMYIASWLLYYNSTDISTVILARVIGASTSSLALVYPYVSEISEPHLRGIFLGIAQMVSVGGTFISLLLGTFMNWRTIALVNLSVPIITGLTVLLAPNSPFWLVSKGQYDKAEEALCSIRGWAQPIQVRSEFNALVESSQKLTSRITDDKTIGRRERWTGTIKLYLQRSFYAPLTTICLIILVYVVGGGALVETFSTIMFREMNSPIEESVASAILGGTSIIGKLIVVSLLHRFGKRKLVLFFSGVVFSCQSLIATIGILKLTDGYYAWIPSIAFIVANLAWRSGIAAIAFMLVGEIFPSDVRYIGTAVSLSFYSIVISIMKKWFLYVVEAVTLPVVFALYAVVNAIELVTYYFLMPETEGKSLQEIEDHFKRDKIDNECSNKSSI